MALGLVLKDMGLAEENQVNATPTILVNGHRLRGIENATKLRELIAAAASEGKIENGSRGAGQPWKS